VLCGMSDDGLFYDFICHGFNHDRKYVVRPQSDSKNARPDDPDSPRNVEE